MIPELFKRAVEIGFEKAQEAPESIKHFVQDRKLPKEAAAYIFSQVEETKNGVFRVVAKEMRDFLEHTNLAGEMQKMLTTLQFEVNTTIRFSPTHPKAAKREEGDEEQDDDDDGEAGTGLKPDIKMDVYTKREGKSSRKKISKEG
ncbi:MAG TPA: hypothetical protein VF316_24745 [Polyangiaceae bacterium]